MTEESSELHGYADEVGLFFEATGLPRMPGRILGWLLVCEPPHQSAEELAAALQASRGSISMAMQMLMGAGAVERYPVPGSRRTYYRMRPGFWLREAEDKARLAGEWRKLADRGLDLMRDRPEESRRRLQEARDMYAFLEEEYARIKDLWLQRQERMT
ncbi:MAG: transcriptional regulator [Streptosporangiales bacterium]|nr:transcriptional regulator [Streptosporangiales bacterium]